jgi:hypothetical protein
LPSTLSPKSGFASNHVCASFGVKKLPQVANMSFRTPAVSVDAGTVIVVVGVTVVVVVGAAVVVVVGAPVVVGATVVVVVGAAVAAGATVVAGAAVVDGAPVVEGTAVVGVATEVVATGAVVSALLLHAEVTSSKTTRTAYFLTASVCHPSPEGGGGRL